MGLLKTLASILFVTIFSSTAIALEDGEGLDRRDRRRRPETFQQQTPTNSPSPTPIPTPNPTPNNSQNDDTEEDDRRRRQRRSHRQHEGSDSTHTHAQTNSNSQQNNSQDNFAAPTNVGFVGEMTGAALLTPAVVAPWGVVSCKFKFRNIGSRWWSPLPCRNRQPTCTGNDRVELRINIDHRDPTRAFNVQAIPQGSEVEYTASMGTSNTITTGPHVLTGYLFYHSGDRRTMGRISGYKSCDFRVEGGTTPQPTPDNSNNDDSNNNTHSQTHDQHEHGEGLAR